VTDTNRRDEIEQYAADIAANPYDVDGYDAQKLARYIAFLLAELAQQDLQLKENQMTMYNFVKLPTGLILNMNTVETIEIQKLSNPKDSFQVVVTASGHRHVVAAELYQRDKAEQVVTALLQAGAIMPIPVETDLRKPRPASVPPELNLH
jgi:hypothetical protein